MSDSNPSRFTDTSFFFLSFCSDDIMGTRTIRIPKNGTLLNLYIAVDVSDSIEDDYIKNATRAVKQLITKVR